MKGLLFTELLEMVEEQYGYATANSIVLNAPLQSKGIYTSARIYHRHEMSLLFEQLQKQTRLPFDLLTQSFGRHLGKRILIAYPQHRPYINRLFTLITKRAPSPVFAFVRADAHSCTVQYNPQHKANCLTDGVIKGYLDYLHQLNRLEEVLLADGKREFVLSLK